MPGFLLVRRQRVADGAGVAWITPPYRAQVIVA
jgi:hypothetical protein